MEEKKNIEIFDGEEYNLDDPNDVAWLNHQKKLKEIEEKSQEEWDNATAKTQSVLAGMAEKEESTAQVNTNITELLPCFKEFI